jgi:hypothetical protein
VVQVRILQRKGHAGPKTPPPVKNIDGPEDTDRGGLFVGVRKEGGVRLTTMQTELKTVACCEADHAPGEALVVAGEVVHALVR